MLVQLNETNKMLKEILKDEGMTLPTEYIEKILDNINEISVNLLLIHQRNMKNLLRSDKNAFNKKTK